MIIYLLIIFAILFFLAWNLLVGKRRLHIIGSIITTILLLGSIILAIMNFHDHYGMHLVEHVSTTELTSSTKDMNMLLYQPVGTDSSTDSHRVIIYKNSKDQNKNQHTKADRSVFNHIEQNDQIESPRLVTRTTNWEYKSSGYKRMFGLVQKPSTEKVVNIFYIPKDWHVLSVQQAKLLPKVAERKQTSIAKETMRNPQLQRKEANAYIQNRLKQVIRKNPQVSNGEKERLIQQFSNDFTNYSQRKIQSKIVEDTIEQTK